MRLPKDADLLAAVNALSREQPKRPTGPGWQTMGMLAKREGISLSAMRQRYRVAVERGLTVERFVGSDFDIHGTLVKQTWFRVKQ